MSGEVVTWAMYHAPMLLTDAGRPDSTARFVLAVLAEAAHKDGTEAFPSPERIRFATGFDTKVIKRALKRLHEAGLIEEDGKQHGKPQWRLAISLQREDSFDAVAAAEKEARRRAETQYRQEYRRGERRRPKDALSGTQDPGQDGSGEDIDGPVSGTESSGQQPPEDDADESLSGTQNSGQGGTKDGLVRDAESRCPGRRVPVSGTQNPGPIYKELTALGTVLRTVPGGRRAAPQTPAQLPLMAGVRSGLVSELEFVDPLTTRALEALPPDVTAIVETERLAEYDRMHEPAARRPRTRKQRRAGRSDPKFGKSA